MGSPQSHGTAGERASALACHPVQFGRLARPLASSGAVRGPRIDLRRSLACPGTAGLEREVADQGGFAPRYLLTPRAPTGARKSGPVGARRLNALTPVGHPIDWGALGRS